jgi:hypothetical protein
MRRDLTAPIAPAPLLDGITLLPFTMDTARASRALLQRVYPEGLGDGGISFEGFWAWLTAEPAYDSHLMFVAAANGAVVGFCHCCASPSSKTSWWTQRFAGAASAGPY